MSSNSENIYSKAEEDETIIVESRLETTPTKNSKAEEDQSKSMTTPPPPPPAPPASEKKISIQEKFAALRKQHLALEEEKLAKVKNDPSRKLISPQSKVDWADVAAVKSPLQSSTTTPTNSKSFTGSTTPQGSKVSSLQNKWKEVLSESKNNEKNRFDQRKQQTISQFRIAQDGIVKQRIGEWEKLFLQAAASVEQMEFFYRKAQQAMLAKAKDTTSTSSVVTGSPSIDQTDPNLNSISVPSQDSLQNVQFPTVSQSFDEGDKVDAKDINTTDPLKGLDTKPEPSNIEDFIINDTKIYSVKEFPINVSNYITKCFKMNKSMNRIPLVCGVFGNEKLSKPPIDIFAAAIKTSDDSIFIALTVIVQSENELNPAVYGVKKIVIVEGSQGSTPPTTANSDQPSYLIEKLLNIVPMEGMVLPFEIEKPTSVTSAPPTPMNQSVSQDKTDQNDQRESQTLPQPPSKSLEADFAEKVEIKEEEEKKVEKEPDITPSSDNIAVPLDAPFKGYLDKLFASTETEDLLEDEKLKEGEVEEMNPVKIEEKIMTNLGFIERSSNQALPDSIELLDDVRQALRNENMTVESIPDVTEDINFVTPSTVFSQENNKKDAEKAPENDKAPILPIVDTVLTKLQQCSKWKNEVNKETREQLELKLLVTLREILETNDISSKPVLNTSPAVEEDSITSVTSSSNTSMAATASKSLQTMFTKIASVGKQSTAAANTANSSVKELEGVKETNELSTRVSDIIDRLKISLKHSNYQIVKASLQTIEYLNNYNLLPSIDKMKELLLTLTSLQTDPSNTNIQRYLSKDIIHCIEHLNNTINTLYNLQKTDEEIRDDIIDSIIVQLKMNHNYEFRSNRLTTSFDLKKLHTKPADRIRKGYEQVKGEGMRNKVKYWLLDSYTSNTLTTSTSESNVQPVGMVPNAFDFLITEKEYFLKTIIYQWLLKECSSWKDTAKSISISERELKDYSTDLRSYATLHQYSISGGFYHHLINIREKYHWDSVYIDKLISSIFHDVIHIMKKEYIDLYYYKIVTELMNLDIYQLHHPNTIIVLKHSLLNHYDNLSFDDVLLMIPLECFQQRSYYNHIYNHLLLQYYEFISLHSHYLLYKYKQFQKLDSKHYSLHTTGAPRRAGRGKNEDMGEDGEFEDNEDGGNDEEDEEEGRLESLERLIYHDFINILLCKFFLFRYNILNEFQYLLLDKYPINTPAHSSTTIGEEGEEGEEEVEEEELMNLEGRDGEVEEDLNNNRRSLNYNRQNIQQIKNYLNIVIGFGLLRYENNYFSHTYSEEQYRELVISLITRINEILYTAEQVSRMTSNNNNTPTSSSECLLQFNLVKQLIHEQYINYYIDNYYMTTESYAQSINSNYIIESFFHLMKTNHLQIQSKVVDHWMIGPRFHPNQSSTQKKVPPVGRKSVVGGGAGAGKKFIPKAEFPMLFFNYAPLYENPNQYLQQLLYEYLKLIKTFQVLTDSLQPLQEKYQQKEEEGNNKDYDDKIEEELKEKVEQYNILQKKIITKKIILTKNILKFVELIQTIQYLNNNTTPTTVATGGGVNSSLLPFNTTNSANNIAITPPLIDVDALYIFESVEDEEDQDITTSANNGSRRQSEESGEFRRSSASGMMSLTTNQRQAIQQLKQSCSLFLFNNYHQEFLLITTEYVKTSYNMIIHHPIYQYYYRIFYFELLDYINFIHYYFPSSNTSSSSTSSSFLLMKQHHQPVTLLMKHCLLQKINEEYNQHGHDNIKIAFPIRTSSSPSPVTNTANTPQKGLFRTQSSKNVEEQQGTGVNTVVIPWIPHYLEYFLQVLTIELVFSQKQILDNLMDVSTLPTTSSRPLSMAMSSGGTTDRGSMFSGGNASMSSATANDNNNGANSVNQGLNTVELFAREQVQRLLSKVKNELWIEESMLRTCYLPQLVEWTAGSIARDKVIVGQYRLINK